MPATIDAKGIASGYSDGENGWGAQQNQNLRQLSAYVMNGFAQDISTTVGLAYGYRGGVGLTGGGLVNLPAGTILLGPNTTTYIVRNIAGVISATTNPVFPSLIHLATVTTNVSNITNVIDVRYSQDLTQDGTLNANKVSASVSVIGAYLGAVQPIAANGVTVGLGNWNAGDDVTLGPMGLAVLVRPSADPAARFGQFQAGDNLALRNMQLRMARLFIGTNAAPAFTADEQVGIEGRVRFQNGAGGAQLGPGSVDHTYLEFYPRTATPTVRGGYIGYQSPGSDDITLSNVLGGLILASNGASLTIEGPNVTASGRIAASVFNGNGSELNTIPLSAVVNLETNLAALVSANSTQDAAIAGKMNTGAGIDAGQLVSGFIPATRYGTAYGWPAQTPGARTNAVPGSVNSGQTVTTSAGPGQPFPDVTLINNALNIIANALRQLIEDLRVRTVI